MADEVSDCMTEVSNYSTDFLIHPLAKYRINKDTNKETNFEKTIEPNPGAGHCVLPHQICVPGVTRFESGWR
jgi:hypothetical protein